VLTAPGRAPSRARARVGLSAVIISVEGTTPLLLTVEAAAAFTGDRAGVDVSGSESEAPPLACLPGAHLDDSLDRTLEQGVRRLVSTQTGLPVRYFEQLYTFGDRDRVPGERELAVAYLALARYQAVQGIGRPRWHNFYELFPWEDWRGGRPEVIDQSIIPAIEDWLAGSPPDRLATRTERAELTFGLRHARWDPVRVLDRYELIYELRLAEEASTGPAARPRGGPKGAARGDLRRGGRGRGLGEPLAFDHRRIAAAALERLRGKLAYRPVVFEVLPESFTLSRLQQVVEALAGQALHKQNFRRLVAAANLVEPTGEEDLRTGGRPAELYRFRREVLRERPAPGLGLRRLGGP
jgi:hypothetical protein